jgi:PAS domain S-box-containing protein
LAAIVTSSSDAMISKTLDGLITTWNPAAEHLFGYTADEAIGQPITLIVPDDRQVELATIMERLTRGESIAHQATVRTRKDGSQVEVSLSISPVRDTTGRIVGAAKVCRDVTEALRTRDQVVALIEAETRYRSLVEQLPAVISLSAPDATQSTLYVSPNSEALFGYTPEEYLADPRLWLQTVHPDDRDRVLADVAHMNATGEAVQDEYRVLAREGRVVWVLEDSTLIRDDDGQPLYWQTVQMDVTARKQAEERQQQSEELFRTAFDHAAIGMSLVGLEGRYLRVNAALCALTGYTEAELLARTFQDITHPDDRAADLAPLKRLLAGEIRAFQAEKRYLRKDGEVIWIRLNSALVHDGHGAPLHYISQIEDITARKAADAELAATHQHTSEVLDRITDNFYALDRQGRFTYLNQATERNFGYSRDELLAHNMWQRFPQGKDTPLYPALQEALADGDPRTLEFHYAPTDRWYETRIYPSQNGVSVFFRDVTDRKRADEALRRALAGAEAATRAKGTFLDLMTHELRTPLQAVLGYSEFLLIAPKGSLTDEQRADIGYIHQAGNRMIALVNQLLDLSRLEAAGFDLATEPIDLNKVIEAVRQDIAPQAGAKGLTVQIAVPEALPPLTGDAERVRQILLNLAGNAMKFTQRGGIQITATATITGGVEVAVIDTGMGITAEAILHIFDAFHQVDSRLSRRHGGSGLGLAIAWKLAQQMGGSISVSSEPDVGSTFTLHLPGVQP